MPLDHLAHPFWIEQVGEALGSLVGFHQVGVVAERAQPYAGGDVEPLRVAVIGGKMTGGLLRKIGGKPTVAFPGDKVRSVGAVDDVGRIDVAAVFLADPLKQAFGSG